MQCIVRSTQKTFDPEDKVRYMHLSPFKVRKNKASRV